ncbi:MAG: helix-turn-helix transcriptional regulator [Iamia sp.]
MTTMARTPFSACLKGELEASGLSQAQLARQVGVSQQTVSKWLGAETQPRIKLLPALAQALQLSTTELSATLVSYNGSSQPLHAEEERLVALTRRLRRLDPMQLAQVEAYVHGLHDSTT